MLPSRKGLFSPVLTTLVVLTVLTSTCPAQKVEGIPRHTITTNHWPANFPEIEQPPPPVLTQKNTYYSPVAFLHSALKLLRHGEDALKSVRLESLRKNDVYGDLGVKTNGEGGRRVSVLGAEQSYEKCLNDTTLFFAAMNLNLPWAVQMMDATGKPSSGVVTGNIQWPGAYEECLLVRALAADGVTSMFSGQYCTFSITTKPESPFLPGVTANAGVCIPDSCDKASAHGVYNALFTQLAIPVQVNGVSSCPNEYPLDKQAIVAIAVFGFFGFLVALGTAVDIVLVQMPKWRLARMPTILRAGMDTSGGSSGETKPLLDSKKPTHAKEPETWLRCQGDEAKCVDMTPPGYTLRSFPRATRGGGVAFLLRNTILDNAVITTTFPFTHASFELTQLTVRSAQPINIFCMYRPPPSRKNESSHSIFLSEFSDFLEHCNLLPGQLLIMGDLNVHFDRPADPVTAKALQLLQMFDLSQAVDVPTHRRGHTLDPVIYRESDRLFRSFSVCHALSSDHTAVMCFLDAAKPPHRPVFQTVRNFKGIDHSQFRVDVASALSSNAPSSADELTSTLRSVLDSHAPPSRREVTQRRTSLWYSSVASELRPLKRERRQAERRCGKISSLRHALDSQTSSTAQPVFQDRTFSGTPLKHFSVVSEDFVRKTMLSTVAKLLISFSVYTNGSKLLSTYQPPGSLTCVHGIRFFSMTWVVLGHTYSVLPGFSANTNPYQVEVYDDFSFQMVANATLSVDTFFVLSGLLVAYLSLKELNKNNGQLNWPMFYFHRFWRLTPVYMMVILFNTALQPYLGSGPNWPDIDARDAMRKPCEENWWTNMLYINNLVHSTQMCEAEAITPGVITSEKHFPAGSAAVDTPVEEGANSFDEYYIKPYCRMGPYIVGLVAGYILYRYGTKIRMHKAVVVIGWLAATGVAVASLFGLYDASKITDRMPLEVWEAALWNALARTAWGVSVVWVIIACCCGYGGFVNTILSWGALVPLSRLTYCIYLIHMSAQNVLVRSFQTPFFMNSINVVMFQFGLLVMCYLVGAIVSLTFEAPMMGLEKILLHGNKKKSDGK
ncbi:hypothetical protein BaRGS_00011741 [Batillaria attramentaria]|uniref:Nose resistant-to-fluoxetine protein N-terminal domain-containing protein n=1 Tax=Batillaria attramentaria TaxID=370345 RepID=A0ABD0LCH5_9CAEN